MGEVDGQRMVDDLARLVAVPSVSIDPAHAADVDASAQLVAAEFRAVGVDVDVVCAGGGLPSVIGRAAGPAGAPTVLLYAHHDVQPVGAIDEWGSDPFTLTARDGRLFGRGSADDKGGVAVHVEAMRAFGGDLPVSVAVLIEGEEEIGSPTLAALIDEHAATLGADVVLAPDAMNAAVLSPTLTVSLRGLVNVLVTVRTADRAGHSGMFGGVVPDALSALTRLLATFADDDGTVVVDGLHPGRLSGDAEDPFAGDVRADSGLLPGVDFIGHGSVAARLWDRPAFAVTGIDAPSAQGAANALVPVAKAAVSIRLAPEDDPAEAFQAIEQHVRKHAPWGVLVDAQLIASARGWRADTSARAMEVAQDVLGATFGTAPTLIGAGGSIPFVATLLDTMPQVQMLATAVQDPATRAHATDESVAPEALVAAAEAEVRMLKEFAHNLR